MVPRQTGRRPVLAPLTASLGSPREPRGVSPGRRWGVAPWGQASLVLSSPRETALPPGEKGEPRGARKAEIPGARLFPQREKKPGKN